MLLDSHAWVLWTVIAAAAAEPYLGARIGKLNTHFHGVSGELYAVDDTTLYLKDFHYDGTGPDAYFWAGSSTRPDHTGFIIPDEKGRTTPLGAYNGQDLVLKLPAGQTISKIRWFSVWCRKFRANFGDLIIPRNLEVPKPAVLKALPTWDHGVSSGRVSLVDAQTFLVPDFKYDGLGPAAYWWVSKGPKQHRGGTRLLDENGSDAPLAPATGKTVFISLPDGLSAYDIDRFGVWCDAAQVDFGSISIPHNVRVPPSPRQLALAQAEAQQRAVVPHVQRVQPVSTAAPVRPTSRTGARTTRGLNCQVLHEPLGLELRWVLERDQAVMQMVGRVRQGEYMSFGLSKDDTKSRMLDADAIVAWIDRNGRGHAVDYYLSSKEQCVGNRGSCPDNKISRGAADSVTMLDAAVLNGYHMVTFRRPQAAQDPNYDQHIYSDGPQAVMWAVGPVNDHSDASYHSVHSQGDMFLDFARQPAWNCPAPDDDATESNSEAEGSADDAWQIPPVSCPADGVFQMQIGPAGGRKGYQAVTGQVGWGIAWYVNGVLIPELWVQRGKTYTFVVEGGNDQENTAKNHPLYITSDPGGGYEHKSVAERKVERVYAGVGRHKNGRPYPTAVGRLCEWQLPLGEQPDEYNSFEQFRQRLQLQCRDGSPAYLRWTPDRNTPDLVYYQCYTHRHLGWKIHVVDSCAASNSTGRRATG
ncbi:protein Skeletor, isoforms B/C [Dermacentor andersoni]|uniref:protein Skeletor, isoforms B/C n=1 Tax=Dermacentor andersoni TaxID=34620 RepID=UPI002155DB4B|nr:protein Skeletor, isoforms B/C-like [Dermacentor andersoni]